MGLRGRRVCGLLAACLGFACAPSQPESAAVPAPLPPAPPAQAPEPLPPAPVPEPELAVEPTLSTRVCAHRDPLRRVFWGDLHVHSALSSDAWNFGVRATPEDAYRYAQGGMLRLPGPEGGTRQVRPLRPLDFMAVTDHAEFLGEVALCTTPGSPVYESDGCVLYRGQQARGELFGRLIVDPAPRRFASICGEDNEHCTRAQRGVWQSLQQAAENALDRSEDCRFTTFVGYEYTSHKRGANLHRNVIFRNEVVPDLPISYLDESNEWGLWERLEEDCLDAGTGCDALAIPHNSNISSGRMFSLDMPGLDTREDRIRRARLRGRIERLVEIMQHKGDSECARQVSGVLGEPDELCDFEKLDLLGGVTGPCPEGPEAATRMNRGMGCSTPLNFARYALMEGLIEQAELGVNSLAFGLVASTDTHNATGGAVEERAYRGHLGTGDDRIAERVSVDARVPGNVVNNPGGLVAVWAEENSRDSLFDAMWRREAYGTSGPRIELRFFGGYRYPENLCLRADFVEQGYRKGVPMGAVLPSLPGPGAAPVFAVSALRDAGTADAPGGLLERVQIVKGWVDAQGRKHQQVYDVAGEIGEASVDLATCEPTGPGHESLCGLWRDPDFDPTLQAFYYARVIENPSCRYSAWECLSLHESQRPRSCSDARVPQTIRERAWSSPIWFEPSAG